MSKAKFHGAKRVYIYIAVSLAMLQFEKGSLEGILGQKKLGIAITGYQLENAQSRDKKSHP